VSTPRLNGILETSLYVDDVDRSVRFYQSLFGFEVIYSGARLTALAVREHQILLLFKKRGSADIPSIPHDGDGQLHVAFAIPAEDLAAWEAQLTANGVAVVQKTAWERGGHSLYFRDPDQHLIELATPGLWSNY